LRPGVYFANILRAAFAPVDLCCATVKSIQHKSWEQLLVECTGKLGRCIVGEIEVKSQSI